MSRIYLRKRSLRLLVPLIAVIGIMGLGTVSAQAAVPGSVKTTATRPIPAVPPGASQAAGAALAPDTSNGGFAFQNGNTGLCIDDSSLGLRDYPCNSESYYSGYQSWRVLVDSSTSNWSIENENTGLCIDDSSQFGLRGYVCNTPSFNSGYQQWIPVNGNPYQLRNVATGLCIDDSSQFGLRDYPCNAASYNSGYQMWTTEVY